MSVNDYGVPTEQNDRLLELAGGCRHDFPYKFRDEPCTKCRAKWWVFSQFPTDHDDNPAVGDGHAMDLGEMVRLWGTQCPNNMPSWVHLRWRGGQFMATVGCGIRSKPTGCGYGATPEAALAAAIIAAVDGEKA